MLSAAACRRAASATASALIAVGVQIHPGAPIASPRRVGCFPPTSLERGQFGQSVGGVEGGLGAAVRGVGIHLTDVAGVPAFDVGDRQRHGVLSAGESSACALRCSWSQNCAALVCRSVGVVTHAGKQGGTVLRPGRDLGGHCGGGLSLPAGLGGVDTGRR